MAAWYRSPSRAGGSPHRMGTVTTFCWVPLPGTTLGFTEANRVRVNEMGATNTRGQAGTGRGSTWMWRWRKTVNLASFCLVKKKKKCRGPFLCLESCCHCLLWYPGRSCSTPDRVVKYWKLVMRELRKHQYHVFDNPREEDFGFKGSLE